MKSTEKKLKLELYNKITFNSFWENPVTIPMELRGYDEQYEAENEPIIQDFYLWSQNLMIDCLESPLGSVFIASEKLKTLLEQFKLAPHAIYEIEVTNLKIDSKYYVFHFLTLFNFINYSKSTYKVIDSISKEKVENFPLKITSRDDYLEVIRSDEFKTKDLKFTSNFYDQKYDLLPSSSSTVYRLVSEELKDALVKEGITGMTFFEYNKLGRDVPILFPE